VCPGGHAVSTVTSGPRRIGVSCPTPCSQLRDSSHELACWLGKLDRGDRAAGVLRWLALGILVLVAAVLWRRVRQDDARSILAWDALARDFMLGFDPGGRTIRGKYRLLRLEISAERRLGMGPLRTRVAARYEGVVPEGLELSARGGVLRGSARTKETLARWLDADRRRELLPELLAGGVHVSGHTATVQVPGLLTDPEALRTLLGRLAELARLLSLR